MNGRRGKESKYRKRMGMKRDGIEAEESNGNE